MLANEMTVGATSLLGSSMRRIVSGSRFNLRNEYPVEICSDCAGNDDERIVWRSAFKTNGSSSKDISRKRASPSPLDNSSRQPSGLSPSFLDRDRTLLHTTGTTIQHSSHLRPRRYFHLRPSSVSPPTSQLSTPRRRNSTLSTIPPIPLAAGITESSLLTSHSAIVSRAIAGKESFGTSTESTGTTYVLRDEINTLLRHPALYDPILVPRFPIVLCHGLYGFDVRGPAFFRLHYWGDVLKILRGKIKAEVFVTAVPGTGAIKQRAHVLHNFLEESEALKGRDVNFIAHSMGGLDARYLLSNIQPKSYHPRSLTTISTPHRGSEFMSWCRANIGIGTDFAEPFSATETPPDLSLPFSLKNPILSRAQVEAAKRLSDANKQAKDAAVAERVRVGNFPGLPYSLGTSLTAYLLDLLDSPAYANLTPSYMRDHFNPATLDREDVAYYSIAARTKRINILHPLWLPKQVLDGAEAARNGAKRGLVGELSAEEQASRGNDGLVTIESAKWGHYLGVLENCDHWEVRGSSGLVGDSVNAVVGGTKEGIPIKEVNGWKWQDVYKAINLSKPSSVSAPSTLLKAVESTASSPASATLSRAQSDHSIGIASLANWIVKRLPSAPKSSLIPDALLNRSNQPVSTSSSSKEKSISSHLHDARLLYGLSSSTSSDSSSSSSAPALPSTPTTSSSSSSSSLNGSKNGKEEKFNLERMCIAICRKLHGDGF